MKRIHDATVAVPDLIAAYDPARPLAEARTIPSAWYTDPRVYALEQRTVFGRNWLAVGRRDQVREAGQYFTAEVAGEPIVVVRGKDDVLRGFFNVCRHHAAIVASEPEGRAGRLRCPYHGWTYSLEGKLTGAPEFEGVCGFDPEKNGLMPVALDVWEGLVFVRLDPTGPRLSDFLGDLVRRVSPLNLTGLHFVERRTWDLECNWKVFVDNYLDGGYHVPHAHKSLGSVLDYAEYRIENGERFCVQSSPISTQGADSATAAVRGGKMAYYFWLYPNFMLNWYEGLMDTNLALPLGTDRTRVIFDFYFADASAAGEAWRRQSIEVAERVQQEDIGVCESVQRGLGSRAYDVGRLSVRREAGEQLFHRLLHADLTAAAE